MHQVQWRVDGEGVVRESVLAIARLPWPRSTPAPRLTAATWIALAIASVLSALWLAIGHGSQGDLAEVQTWVAAWAAGQNPYQSLVGVDYPPHAFAVLSLFSLSGTPTALALYACLNAALSIGACYLLVRWFDDLSDAKLSATATLSLVAMLLSSRAIRRAIGFGQTTPLVLMLFVAAMMLARRRPVVAGICFALASFKLNLAVGFGLALLLLGDFVPLLVAGGLVVVATAAFAWSVHQPIVDVLASYVLSMSDVYGGAGFLPGVTGLRSALAALVPDFQFVQLLYPSIAGLLLGVLLTLSYFHRPTDARSRTLTVMACLLWSFTSLPHQRYNTVLLFPAVWMMRWRNGGLVEHPLARWLLGTAALLMLIMNIPDPLELRLVEFASILPQAIQAFAAFAVDVINAHATRLLVFVAFLLILRRMATQARGDAA